MLKVIWTILLLEEALQPVLDYLIPKFYFLNNVYKIYKVPDKYLIYFIVTFSIVNYY